MPFESETKMKYLKRQRKPGMFSYLMNSCTTMTNVCVIKNDLQLDTKLSSIRNNATGTEYEVSPAQRFWTR